MKCTLAVATTLLLAACAGGPVGNPAVPQPAKNVQLDRYLGTWFEMARYENRFEKDCEGVTARYSLRDNRRDDPVIDVLNSCRAGRTDGPPEEAEGTARVVEGSGNAKLKVSFFGPFAGNYWVLDRADDYSWSIVGEPSGRFLWILTREAVPTDAQKADLFARAKALGYDTAMLRFTQQPPQPYRK